MRYAIYNGETLEIREESLDVLPVGAKLVNAQFEIELSKIESPNPSAVRTLFDNL